MDMDRDDTDIDEVITDPEMAKSKRNQNLLHIYAKTGQLDLIMNILRGNSYPHLIKQKDIYGRTPIFYSETEKIANVLYMHGADVRIKDIHGRTAIEYNEHIKNATKDLCPGYTDVFNMNVLGRRP